MSVRPGTCTLYHTTSITHAYLRDIPSTTLPQQHMQPGTYPLPHYLHNTYIPYTTLPQQHMHTWDMHTWDIPSITPSITHPHLGHTLYHITSITHAHLGHVPSTKLPLKIQQLKIQQPEPRTDLPTVIRKTDILSPSCAAILMLFWLALSHFMSAHRHVFKRTR